MENNFKFIVYQTINIKNNKIYIGVHKTKDVNIFDGYIGCGVNINYPSTYMNPKFPFQIAVKKYGTSSFKRSILYIFNNEEEAYLKEREIVNIDFVKREDTYNIILGGDLRPLEYTRKNIYQFDETGKLIKKWEDVYAVTNFYGINKTSVYNSINKRESLLKHYWGYDNKIDINKYSNINKSNKVYKYSEQGKCLEIYDSLNQAAKKNGYKPCTLYSRIKEQSCTGGFYYSFKCYDEFVIKPRTTLKNKTIHIYDLEGAYITSLNFKEVKKYIGLNSNNRIYNLIKTKSAFNGFQLRLIKHDKIDKYTIKNNGKPVYVYKINGEFVKEFDSISSACKELNLDRHSVNRILNGVQRSTKGYIIKKIKDIV